MPDLNTSRWQGIILKISEVLFLIFIRRNFQLTLVYHYSTKITQFEYVSAFYVSPKYITSKFVQTPGDKTFLDDIRLTSPIISYRSADEYYIPTRQNRIVRTTVSNINISVINFTAAPIRSEGSCFRCVYPHNIDSEVRENDVM